MVCVVFNKIRFSIFFLFFLSLEVYSQISTGNALQSGVVLPGYTYVPPKILLNPQNELYCLFSTTEDGQVFKYFIRKYDTDLKRIIWEKRLAVDTVKNINRYDIQTNPTGDLILINNRQLVDNPQKPEDYVTIVTKFGSVEGDSIFSRSFLGFYISGFANPSGNSFHLFLGVSAQPNLGTCTEHIEFDFEVSGSIMKRDSLYVATTAGVNYSVTEHGIEIFGQQIREPVMDPAIVSTLDTGIIWSTLSPKNELKHKYLGDYCCFHTISWPVKVENGYSLLLARHSSSLKIDDIIISGSRANSKTTLVRMDDNTGKLALVRFTGELGGNKSDALARFNSGVLQMLQNDSAWHSGAIMKLINPWTYEAIWERPIEARDVTFQTDGKSTIIICGAFTFSIQIEQMLFEAPGNSYFIAKYDVEKLQLPVLTEPERKIVYYPNPTYENITIEFQHYRPSDQCRYFLNSSIGNLVRAGDVRSIKTNLNIEDLSAGIYYLSIYDGKKLIGNSIVIVLHP